MAFGMPDEHWALKFRRSISGWVLVAARKPGGRIYRYPRIPKHVRAWALADERGRLDAEAVRIVEKKAGGKMHKGGKYEVTIEATDVSPRMPSRRSRSRTSRMDPLTRVARRAARTRAR